MTELLTAKEPIEEKPIKFINAINDGKKYLTFVHCPTKKSDVIIYGWIDSFTEVTHEMLFLEAVETCGFNEDYKPIGGGLINSKSCECLDSIQYGGVDERILKAAMHKAHCES